MNIYELSSWFNGDAKVHVAEVRFSSLSNFCGNSTATKFPPWVETMSAGRSIIGANAVLKDDANFWNTANMVTEFELINYVDFKKYVKNS